MIRRSCRDLGRRCSARLVVQFSAVTRDGVTVKIASCAAHAREWIWDLRDKFPGHRGIRTEKVDE